MSFLGITASAYNPSGPAPDTNLAWNNAGDGYWYAIPATTINVSFNSSSTITGTGTYATGPTDWYTGTPTGSNFEVKFQYTAISSDGTALVEVGEDGSLSTLTLGSTSSWYNLGADILVQSTQVTGTYAAIDVTVTIREVAVTTNSISRSFTLEWAF
jgi:hypothetical protein